MVRSTGSRTSTRSCAVRASASATPIIRPALLLAELGSQPLESVGLVGELQPFLQGDLAALEQPEEAGIQALHPAAVVGCGVEIPVDLEDLVLADQVGDGIALQQDLQDRPPPLSARVTRQVLRDDAAEEDAQRAAHLVAALLGNDV